MPTNIILARKVAFEADFLVGSICGQPTGLVQLYHDSVSIIGSDSWAIRFKCTLDGSSGKPLQQQHRVISCCINNVFLLLIWKLMGCQIVIIYYVLLLYNRQKNISMCQLVQGLMGGVTKICAGFWPFLQIFMKALLCPPPPPQPPAYSPPTPALLCPPVCSPTPLLPPAGIDIEDLFCVDYIPGPRKSPMH